MVLVRLHGACIRLGGSDGPPACMRLGCQTARPGDNRGSNITTWHAPQGAKQRQLVNSEASLSPRMLAGPTLARAC